jgi:hypothetical protein
LFFTESIQTTCLQNNSTTIAKPTTLCASALSCLFSSQENPFGQIGERQPQNKQITMSNPNSPQQPDKAVFDATFAACHEAINLASATRSPQATPGAWGEAAVAAHTAAETLDSLLAYGKMRGATGDGVDPLINSRNAFTELSGKMEAAARALGNGEITHRTAVMRTNVALDVAKRILMETLSTSADDDDKNNANDEPEVSGRIERIRDWKAILLSPLYCIGICITGAIWSFALGAFVSAALGKSVRGSAETIGTVFFYGGLTISIVFSFFYLLSRLKGVAIDHGKHTVTFPGTFFRLRRKVPMSKITRIQQYTKEGKAKMIHRDAQETFDPKAVDFNEMVVKYKYYVRMFVSHKPVLFEFGSEDKRDQVYFAIKGALQEYGTFD